MAEIEVIRVDSLRVEEERNYSIVICISEIIYIILRIFPNLYHRFYVESGAWDRQNYSSTIILKIDSAEFCSAELYSAEFCSVELFQYNYFKK